MRRHRLAVEAICLYHYLFTNSINFDLSLSSRPIKLSSKEMESHAYIIGIVIAVDGIVTIQIIASSPSTAGLGQ